MSRVLIIEDEASLRGVLRRILEQTGHTVYEAPDGRIGMALWRRERTDVVVTDIYMPYKDGIEVLLEIRKSVIKPKVICMSGGGQRGALDWSMTALSLGADGVLMKPFDQQRFLAVMKEVVADAPVPCEAGPGTPITDQRKHPRVPVYFPVSFGDKERVQTGVVRDISREGCRIHCPDAAPDLQYFQVQIQLVETRETLWVDLAVRRWVKDGSLGVEFIKMTPKNRARLQTLIRICEEAEAEVDRSPQPRLT